MRKIVIAIDGYSACGKSSTAKKVAEILGYSYIDSGAMYRAVTLFFLENHITLTNDKEVAKALQNIDIDFRTSRRSAHNSDTYLNGLNVEREIRKMEISNSVSQVSSIKSVRGAMVNQQRKLGRKKAVVMDGRDIGTVVFPDAELKVFMLADVNIRAERRQQELFERKEVISFNRIVENLKMRDEIDTSRTESPLRQALDAVVVNTTFMTLEEQVDEVVNLALNKILA
ncbi:MAG: (d)CMP kinase [Bacteroidota bacterium]